MQKLSSQKTLRINPFWAFRDPLTGRWLTLMSSDQCKKLGANVFVPKRRHPQGKSAYSKTEQSDASAS